MSRPTRVKVGPFTWRISQDDPADAETMGETALRELVIRIDGSLCEDVWRETLLHELLHACHLVCGLGAETNTNAETVVTMTSPVLLDLLRSNPRVRAYLLE